MELFRQQNAQSKTVQQNYESTYLQDEVINILKDKASCLHSFPVGSTVDDLVDETTNLIQRDVAGSPVTVYSASQIVANNSLQIPATRVLTLKNLSSTPPANSIVDMDLVFHVDRYGGGSFIGPKEIYKTIKLKVRTDATSKLLECSTGSLNTNLTRCRLFMRIHEHDTCTGRWSEGTSGWADATSGSMSVINTGGNIFDGTSRLRISADVSCITTSLECQ